MSERQTFWEESSWQADISPAWGTPFLLLRLPLAAGEGLAARPGPERAGATLAQKGGIGAAGAKGAKAPTPCRGHFAACQPGVVSGGRRPRACADLCRAGSSVGDFLYDGKRVGKPPSSEVCHRVRADLSVATLSPVRGLARPWRDVQQSRRASGLPFSLREP